MLRIAIHNKAIQDYEYLNYAQSVKFDICERFDRVEDMEEIIIFFEKQENNRKYHNTIVSFKAILDAKLGNVNDAIKYFNSNIRNYTNQAKDRFQQKLLKYYKE